MSTNSLYNKKYKPWLREIEWHLRSKSMEQQTSPRSENVKLSMAQSFVFRVTIIPVRMLTGFCVYLLVFFFFFWIGTDTVVFLKAVRRVREMTQRAKF